MTDERDGLFYEGPARRARRPKLKRRTGIVLTAVLAVALTAGIPQTRVAILEALGRALVVSDPVGSADVIVVSVDTGGAGVLEAADLVRSGVSTTVAVSAERPTPADLEFQRRGVPYEDAAQRSLQQLASLGVANRVRIPRTVTGTNTEGEVLLGWAEEQRFRSVVVVTTSDHARRTRRVLHRAMKGRQMNVYIRPSRYSTFDPNTWWQSRTGLRTEIVELQKLVLDFVIHPIP